MKHEIIYTEDYALIVSDEIIKENDFCYDLVASPGYKNYKSISRCSRTAEDSYWNTHSKKIIGHRPLKDAHILKGVPLLPEFSPDDDVEKLANDYANQFVSADFDNSFDCVADVDFKAGYNKAKETYKYTEEDLRKAIEMARGIKDSKGVFEIEDISGFAEVCTYGWKEKHTDNEIIQYLQQPKLPKYFECKMDTARIPYGDDGWKTIETGMKTITNSQGQTELVGQYIFNIRR